MLPLSPQQERVLLTIKSRGTITVGGLATALQLSKTATRAQLLTIEALGLIERVADQTGGRGRPPLAFRVSTRGLAVFPSAEAEVLRRLLVTLDDAGHQELVRSVFLELWREREADFERELGPQTSLEQRVDALRVVLERHGFMPEIEVRPGVVEIRECNCPFRGAVQATAMPCRLEARFLERAVGGRIEHIEIAPETAGCGFRLQTTGV